MQSREHKAPRHFESSLDQIDPDTLTQLNPGRQFSPLSIVKKVVRDPSHEIVEIAESKKRLAAGSKILRVGCETRIRDDHSGGEKPMSGHDAHQFAQGFWADLFRWITPVFHLHGADEWKSERPGRCENYVDPPIAAVCPSSYGPGTKSHGGKPVQHVGFTCWANGSRSWRFSVVVEAGSC